MVCQNVAKDACAALLVKLRPDSHDENQYLYWMVKLTSLCTLCIVHLDFFFLIILSFIDLFMIFLNYFFYIIKTETQVSRKH